MINDYVAFILNASQSLGIKVVNPGGINAFKFNQRALDVDEKSKYSKKLLEEKYKLKLKLNEKKI